MSTETPNRVGKCSFLMGCVSLPLPESSNISISKKGEDGEGKGREVGRRRKDGQKGRRKKETLT